MNVLDAKIIEILRPPYFKYNKWWVGCTVEAYGVLSETEVMNTTEQKATAVKVGDIVQI